MSADATLRIQNSILAHAQETARRLAPDENVQFNALSGLINAATMLAAAESIPEEDMIFCLKASVQMIALVRKRIAAELQRTGEPS